MDRIVVDIDCSPHATIALRWAMDHAARHTMAVTAVRPSSPHRHNVPCVGAPSGFVITDDDVPRFDRVADAQLDVVVDDDVDRSVTIDVRLVHGSPGAVLLAADLDPSLAVIGRRGHSSSGHGVLGSVSELVVSTAPRVVVVVPDTDGR